MLLLYFEKSLVSFRNSPADSAFEAKGSICKGLLNQMWVDSKRKQTSAPEWVLMLLLPGLKHTGQEGLSAGSC